MISYYYYYGPLPPLQLETSQAQLVEREARGVEREGKGVVVLFVCLEIGMFSIECFSSSTLEAIQGWRAKPFCDGRRPSASLRSMMLELEWGCGPERHGRASWECRGCW
jgi:hypothetical protein